MPVMESGPRILLGIGFVCILLAFVWMGLSHLTAGKIQLGKLPGDFSYHRKGVSFYFPLATSILVSALLTLLSFLWRKFFTS